MPLLLASSQSSDLVCFIKTLAKLPVISSTVLCSTICQFQVFQSTFLAASLATPSSIAHCVIPLVLGSIPSSTKGKNLTPPSLQGYVSGTLTYPILPSGLGCG